MRGRGRLALALIAVAVFVAAFAVPALGGPSIGQIAKQAAKALKLAKTADKRSKRALALAKRAVGGTNGANGTNGSQGSVGPPGPAGPAGPSGAQKVDYRAAAGGPEATIFSAGGLTLKAACAAGPNLQLHASTSVDNSEIHVEGVRGPNGTATPVYTENDHFSAASGAIALPQSNFQGTLTYSTPSGAVVTITYAAEQSAFGGTVDCWVGGWALHDPS